MDNPSEIVTPTKVKSMTFSDILFICFMVFVVFAVAYVGRLAYLEGMKTEGSKQNGEAIAAWLTQSSADRFKDNFNPTECAGGLLPPIPVLSLAPESGKTDQPKDSAASEPSALASAAEAPATRAPLKPEAVASSTTSPTQSAETVIGNATTAAQVSNGSEPVAVQNVARTWSECLKYLTSDKGPWSKMSNPFNDEPLTFIDKCDPTNHEIPGFIVLESINPTPPGSAVPSYTNPLASTDAIDKKMLLRVTICDKGSYPIPIADIEF